MAIGQNPNYLMLKDFVALGQNLGWNNQARIEYKHLIQFNQARIEYKHLMLKGFVAVGQNLDYLYI